MKYILTFILVIVLITGCSGGDNTDPAPTPSVNTESTPIDTETVMPHDFNAFSCRTDGAVDNIKTPPDIIVFRNETELSSYANKINSCDLDKYDAYYFSNYILIIARITEGSISIWHNVAALETIGNTTTVYLERLLPLERLDEEANWHIIIEAPIECDVDNIELKVSDYHTVIDKLSISTGNTMHIGLYSRRYSANTYVPKVGRAICECSEHFDSDEVLENLIVAEWNDNFQINVYLDYCSIGDFRVYDETLENYSVQSDTLDISLFEKPGTYIIRFIATWTLGTKHGADQPDTVSDEYFFSLDVGEEDFQ